MTRVISVGLDGAAWHKLDRLIEQGHLPNLEAIADRGARAPLRSVLPPVTCPAWRCSTSGKNPGKLGVFWWLDFDARDGSVSYPNSTSFETADIWDYLSDEGHRSAILNVPMTHPPTEFDGTMVSGFGAPFEDDPGKSGPITHPPEFEAALYDAYDWKIGVDNITTQDGLEETYEVIRSRFELLLDLLEEDFQFLHLTIFYINMLQHKYGDGPETRRGWEIIDHYLGELRDEDGLLLLYSDHGHSNIEHTFVVNRWLMERGHLTLESSRNDELANGLYSLLSRTGIAPKGLARVTREVFPDSFSEWVLTLGSPTSTSGLFDRVVWAETDAVALSQGPVYLNEDRLGHEYDTFRSNLQEEMKSLSWNGTQVLADVHDSADIYDGPYTHRGPDLVLESTDGWEVYGGLAPSVFETQPTSWTTGNHSRGMVAVDGPGVNDCELGARSILDIAPTILAALDCAVPHDMDGAPIDAAFDQPLTHGTRSPFERTAQPEAPQSGDLEGRLEDLGYLE